MKASRFIVLLCAITPLGIAQIHPHFGVDVGVPFTDTLSSSSYVSTGTAATSIDQYNSKTKRLLIGPVFRVDLVHGLGLEFDALYQRVNYDHTSSSSSPGFFYWSFEQTTANRWQFPVLGQYDFTVSKAKLFVEGGPSISHFANTSSNIVVAAFSSPLSTILGSSGPTATLAGITTGGGVDLPLFHLHLRPEIRYSHWFLPTGDSTNARFIGAEAFLTSPSSSAFHFDQNEASFVLGLTF